MHYFILFSLYTNDLLKQSCCEPPVGLGQSTGGGLGSSAVFLIQNTSFILNLISVTLIVQYL